MQNLSCSLKFSLFNYEKLAKNLQNTSECQCKENHRGRNCRECDIGFQRKDLQSPCVGK